MKTFQQVDPDTTRQVFALVPDFYKKTNNKFIAPVTPDGRFQIKIGVNGKLDLYEVKTGKMLASLIALDENDWVVTDPAGRFDASPNAHKLMHYVIGLEPIDFDQIKDRYYTPNLLQKILKRRRP